MIDIHSDATTWLGRIARGEVSAASLLDAHIERIEDVDPHINALVVRRFEDARAEASAADEAQASGATLGPLHGLPITIKEQFDVVGLPTHLGVPAQSGYVAHADGPLVSRLRAAGAIILGKTNVMMTLAGWETDNPVYGRTQNPWNLDRTPGGSSGGEAALIAARGSCLGLGGDFGGSVRVPSSHSGIHGLKPTSTRLTNTDVPPHLFCSGQEAINPQPGPMARSVADLALAMRVLADPPSTDAADLPPPVPWPTDEVQISGLRVGVVQDNGVVAPSAAVRRAVAEAGAHLESRGAQVVPFDVPEFDAAWRLFLQVNAAGNNESLPRTLGGSPPHPLLKGMLRGVTMPAALRPLVMWGMRRGDKALLAEVIDNLRPVSAEAYWRIIEQKNQLRAGLMHRMAALGIDLLVCPVYATPAPPHGVTERLLPVTTSYALLANVTGFPAGVVAATRVREDEQASGRSGTDDVIKAAGEADEDSHGMPVGVQVVGMPWQEHVVLAGMAALEQAFKGSPDYPLAGLPTAVAAGSGA